MLDPASLPYIEIESSQYAGQRFHILESVTIGRSKKNDVCLKQAQGLSRAHCMIDLSEDGYVIEDLDSRNGTYLNGIRVAHPVILKNDDVIQIGEVLIRYFQPLSLEETSAHIELHTAQGGMLAQPSTTTAFGRSLPEDDESDDGNDFEDDSELYEISEDDLRSVRESKAIDSIEDDSLASGLAPDVFPELAEETKLSRLETEAVLTENIIDDQKLEVDALSSAATERISREEYARMTEPKKGSWFPVILLLLVIAAASPFVLDMFGFRQPMNWLTALSLRMSEQTDKVIEQSKKRLDDPKPIQPQEVPVHLEQAAERPELKPVLSSPEPGQQEQHGEQAQQGQGSDEADVISSSEKQQDGELDKAIADITAPSKTAAHDGVENQAPSEGSAGDLYVIHAPKSGQIVWRAKAEELVNAGDVLGTVTSGYTATTQRKIKTLNDEIIQLKVAAQNGSLRAAKDLVRAKEELSAVKRGKTTLNIRAKVSGKIIRIIEKSGSVRSGEVIAEIRPIE